MPKSGTGKYTVFQLTTCEAWYVFTHIFLGTPSHISFVASPGWQAFSCCCGKWHSPSCTLLVLPNMMTSLSFKHCCFPLATIFCRQNICLSFHRSAVIVLATGNRTRLIFLGSLLFTPGTQSRLSNCTHRSLSCCVTLYWKLGYRALGDSMPFFTAPQTAFFPQYFDRASNAASSFKLRTQLHINSWPPLPGTTACISSLIGVTAASRCWYHSTADSCTGRFSCLMIMSFAFASLNLAVTPKHFCTVQQ